MGCCIDFNRREISFFKNGKDLGVAFNNINVHDTYYPAIVLKNAEVEMIFNPTSNYANATPITDAPSDFKIQGKGIRSSSSSTDLKKWPSALIIEPSRELALQTAQNIEMFSRNLKSIKYVSLVGGENPNQQIRAIENGVDIVIATPGRLIDFIQTGKLSLDNIRFLVLDEADALIKQEKGIVESIHARCPLTHPIDGKRLQVIVCSATLHNFDIKQLANKIMKFPSWVDLKGQDSVPDTVHHCVLNVQPRLDRSWESNKGYKTDGVHLKDNTRAGANTKEQWSESVKILKALYTLKFIQVHKCDKGIIFCRTKLDCDNMERFLKANDRSATCVCLHSDRKPQERNDNLKKFKENKVKFLICTDVAARGIDVKGIPYVINVTLPDLKENYVHRIGRVGRAERMGLAVSFVSIDENEKVWYHSNCNKRGGKGCYN